MTDEKSKEWDFSNAIDSGIYRSSGPHGLCISFSNPTPKALTFNVGGKPLVTIHEDHRIELHDGATPNDAAKAFWDAVIKMAPWVAE